MHAPSPLADPWRLPLLALVLVALLGLGAAYTRLVITLPDGIRACLADPASHDGTLQVFPVWFVSGVDGPDRYRVSRVVKDVVVEGPSEGLERGQVITVVGHFRARDSVVVQVRREIHHLRPYKMGLSLVGLLLAMVAAPWRFTWRDGYLRVRGGDDPSGGRDA